MGREREAREREREARERDGAEERERKREREGMKERMNWTIALFALLVQKGVFVAKCWSHSIKVTFDLKQTHSLYAVSCCRIVTLCTRGVNYFKDVQIESEIMSQCLQMACPCFYMTGDRDGLMDSGQIVFKHVCQECTHWFLPFFMLIHWVN